MEINNVLLAPYFPVVVNLVMGAFVTAVCLNRGNWLLGTFSFSIFFFAYTTIPLIILSADAKHYWFQHPPPVGLSLVATAFFGTVLAATASAQISATRSIFSRLPRLPVFALGLFSVSILLAYGQHVVASGGWAATLVVKGMISALGMTVVALALTVLTRNDRRFVQSNGRGVYCILFSALVLCTTIAFFEVVTQDAWVMNRNRDSLVEFRSSATFHNPNFFGVWAAAMALATAYAAVLKVRYLVHPMLALSAVAIFLSGSRTALLLTLICLALPTALVTYFRLSARTSIVSLAAFLFYLFAVIAIAFVWPSIDSGALASNFSGFYALAVRFISLPGDLVNFMIGTATEPIEMSIRGRFVGDAVDNGFLAMRSDSGVGNISAVCWALFWVSLMWAGLRRLALSPSLNGIYAVTALTFCVLVGLTMQAYQAFPVWAFVALQLNLFWLWLLGEGSCDH